MKVKLKVILITIISIVMTVLITTSIMRVILIQYIQKQENTDVGVNYKRVHAIFQKEEATLESIIMDWAYWDDTYQFIQDENEEYIDNNLQDSSMAAIKLNFMLFVDNKGNIVFPKIYNWESQDQKILLSQFEQSLNLKETFNLVQSASKPITGILMLSGIPTLISISPVTTSDHKSPTNGVLVIGRIIDVQFIKYLEEVLQINLNIEDSQKSELIYISKQNNYQKISIDDSEIWAKRDADEIKSYTIIKDIWGRPDISLMFIDNREMFHNGMAAISYFAIFFSISFGIVGIGCISITDKLIINRLNSIDGFMENVSKSKDTKARIHLTGNDEISRLAVNTNVMLEEIDKHYSDMKIMDERFNLIMEATNDGYFDANISKQEIYISPTWLTFLGYEDSTEFLYFDKLIDRIYSEDKELFLSHLEESLSGKVEYLKLEYRMLKKSGELIWVEVRGKLVESDHLDNPIRFIGTVSDIATRKKYEEENIYLSQTDVTTTLKNRTFMENLLEKVAESNQCSSWIIMGDVNGLKLINDTFGHQEGDRLLLIIGSILIKCCSYDDIPARWGGDEFVILVKDKDEFYVKNLISSIKKVCDEVTNYPIKISIALGSAKKELKNSSMDDVLKSAEERMYRNKLLESRSARSAILASLEQSLHEKHIETEEHTKRIKQICMLIGSRMGLSQDELDELALLGSLHDIGKIGIPEDILLKPDKLTKVEWDKMKTHTEIGYRIASATPELTHIADEILSHHERYDGTGYPQGLKGTDIPKLSRLINIVDSFDVMTHDRPYKKAMSLESVIREIRDCSGKQFDAEMVESFLTLLNENHFSS